MIWQPYLSMPKSEYHVQGVPIIIVISYAVFYGKLRNIYPYPC